MNADQKGGKILSMNADQKGGKILSVKCHKIIPTHM